MAPLIRKLAADDCALLLWTVCPEQPGALELIKACGFKFKTVGFSWLKTTPNAEIISTARAALGHGLRHRARPMLLAVGATAATRADVHQVVIAPIGENSVKPDEVYRRIERLYPGPYLE